MWARRYSIPLPSPYVTFGISTRVVSRQTPQDHPNRSIRFVNARFAKQRTWPISDNTPLVTKIGSDPLYKLGHKRLACSVCWCLSATEASSTGSNPTHPCTTPCSMENSKVALAVSAPNSCATGKRQASDGEEQAKYRRVSSNSESPPLDSGPLCSENVKLRHFRGGGAGGDGRHFSKIRP